MTTKEHPLDLRTDEHELLVRQAADQRRLYELAEAVRAHEAMIRSQIGGPRPHDLALYRRLRRVGGSSGDGLMSLADAVRAHQVLTRNRAVPTRPADHSLYGRLDQR